MRAVRYSSCMKPEVNAWELWLLLKLAAKFGFVPAGLGAGWLGRRWMLSRSTHWPVVYGTVSGVRSNPLKPQFACVVTYTYVVNGEYYAGTLALPKSKRLKNEEDVSVMLPKGGSIEVRYSPRNPAQSVALLPPALNGVAA